MAQTAEKTDFGFAERQRKNRAFDEFDQIADASRFRLRGAVCTRILWARKNSIGSVTITRNLARTYGINSEVALMDDVPGHPTSIAVGSGGQRHEISRHGRESFYRRCDFARAGKSSVLLAVARRKQGFDVGFAEQTRRLYGRLDRLLSRSLFARSIHGQNAVRYVQPGTRGQENAARS